jgi:bile acid:Na+ symporter, BASS family
MNQSLLRTAKLLGAMILGLAVPAAQSLHFLIPYFIMGMLWVAFLDIRPVGFRKEHLFLLALNWAVGLAAWSALLPFNRELAFAALLVGLTPTATASPVITGMLGGRVEFVAGSVLITNVAAGLLFPVVLPRLLGANLSIETAPFLKQTVLVILVPLLLAQGMRWGVPGLAKRVSRYRKVSFYLWLAVLFLVTSNAGQFLRTHWSGNWPQVLGLAALSVALCAINFALGWKMGDPTGVSRELSQSLGQKNTVLTIWIALTYVSPIVALGPTFYIICHNTYNAWQLARCPVDDVNAA